MSVVAPQKPDYSTYPTLSRDAASAAARELLAMRGDGQRVDIQTLHSIEMHYCYEARLLDEERHSEWYETLADDLFYWMPLVENRFRKDGRALLSPEHMALFDERKADIAIRIGRLESKRVWTEDPPTRHVYSISNVEAFLTDTPGEFEAHSVFVQYRNRNENDEATLIGRRRDILRRGADDGYLLARRLILSPQSVLLTKNLTAFF